MTTEQIKKKLSILLVDLRKKYPIKSFEIFGSYARGDQTDESDLDILVEFNGKIGIKFIDLAEEIEQKTGMKIDLVSWKAVKKRYFNEISKDIISV